VARIAYQLPQHTLPRYFHPKSPHHFTLSQLAACVWWMFYLDLKRWPRRSSASLGTPFALASAACSDESRLSMGWSIISIAKCVPGYLIRVKSNDNVTER